MKILEDDLQQQLLSQLSKGDEPSFNALYKAYSRPLFLRVVNMIKSEDDAQEIIQELFIKLWQNRDTIDTIKSFQSYIFTIANNLVYNYFRKISHNQALINKLLLNAADHYLDGQELLENKEAAEIFRKAINQLPPQSKQVFQLCKIDGKSHKEVADLMGISMPTVNSHMTNAVRSIREYILKNQDVAILLMSAYTVSGMMK
ncbi:putative RNA polymerase sigma factor FecI [compost metagenome]